jgi:hypothetical protein
MRSHIGMESHAYRLDDAIVDREPGLEGENMDIKERNGTVTVIPVSVRKELLS